ncbi:hypothetical protein IV38_GL001945 [Lactobacillus selangorensis]|uniref:NTP-binding protein n=1 Tax=Lactobacillus selangorensis TaxID=81857 RepID=A0A0R2FPE8_9LACO|nr:AAA family ATPase [Lactobacillus selangorensis]KRN27731.1 hypothetical protein IV38_GL001945 [Lactobacillus selangorensis]KRN30304.1 hypothetical protein IV40_GL001892 [Lactobacillus selangorensis]
MILPKNRPHQTIDTPHNFFIYGATMSGKSYLAGHFPNPIFLNTDGNSLANEAPSIQLKNDLKTGQSVIEQLDEFTKEIETMNSQDDYGYETIVIDVIDDVATLIEQAICQKANVKALSDIPYGKGYATFNSVLQGLVMSLKAMPVNVIYISRVAEKIEDDGSTKEIPSLKTKYYNIVNGNCDLVIHTQQIGSRYLRTIDKKRKNYYESKIDDSNILRLLKAIPGAITKEQKTEKVGK